MGRPFVLAGLLLLPHAACINYFKGLNTVADLEATGILEKGEHTCPSHHRGWMACLTSSFSSQHQPDHVLNPQKSPRHLLIPALTLTVPLAGALLWCVPQVCRRRPRCSPSPTPSARTRTSGGCNGRNGQHMYGTSATSTQPRPRHSLGSTGMTSRPPPGLFHTLPSLLCLAWCPGLWASPRTTSTYPTPSTRPDRYHEHTHRLYYDVQQRILYKLCTNT